MNRNWYQVSERPKEWAFGVLIDDKVCNIVAFVSRYDNGSWNWCISKSPFFGNEKTKQMAIEAVLSYIEKLG